MALSRHARVMVADGWLREGMENIGKGEIKLGLAQYKAAAEIYVEAGRWDRAATVYHTMADVYNTPGLKL